MFPQDVRVARFTGAAALGVALLYLLSIPIGSLASAPASDASGASVLHFFSEHRSGLLFAIALNGVAWCALMPAAFAGVSVLLRERGGGTAASVALICAGVEAALIGVGLIFAAIAAYAAPNLSPELARVLGGGLNIAASASAWPTVPCVLALGLAARRAAALPGALLIVGVLVATLHAITAVGFARSGALSPTGIALAAPPAFAILMACVGVSLLRSAATRALAADHAGATFSPDTGRP